MGAVREALAHVWVRAPQGDVHVDRDSRQAYLAPRIGISNAAGGFDIIYEAPAPVKPDPYLVWHDAKTRPGLQPVPGLRLVR
jgi:branched-chain amino acid transport system substrate-binding protein